MNIEMNETYARDTSTVWEHEIISSASDLKEWIKYEGCLLYTSPSPRDGLLSRMPSSA